MKILYSRGSNNRKPNYAVMTQLVKSKTGEVHVEKIALTDEAKLHLDTIVKDYSRIKLPKGYSLTRPKRASSSIVTMPFIKGENLEKSLFVALRNRDSSTILSLFKTIEDLLLYDTSLANPVSQKDFVASFGNTFSKRTLCSALGLIDLNFDNFIRTKNEIYIVDYEWYFHNTKIPVDYLLSRLLYYTFAVKFKDIMYYLPTKESPVVEIFEGYRVPDFIYKKYKKCLETTEQMLITEQVLQNTILITQNKGEQVHRTYTYKTITQQTPPYVEEMYLDKIGYKAERDSLKEQLHKQGERLLELQSQNKVLLNKINKLRNLPLIKPALKVRRIIKRRK